MAPDSENLLYTRCSHTEACNMDSEVLVQCQDEGWLYCTLCRRHYCEDHACGHLSAQLDHDIHGINYDAINQDTTDVDPLHSNTSDDSNISFGRTVGPARGRVCQIRELSQEELTNVAEIELRSYFRRLLREAKRVSREIERRMIYSTELTGGIRKQTHLSGDQLEHAKNKRADLTPLGLLERQAREAREAAKLKKNQENIAAAIKTISQQMKLGNVNLDQLKKKVGA